MSAQRVAEWYLWIGVIMATVGLVVWVASIAAGMAAGVSVGVGLMAAGVMAMLVSLATMVLM